MYRKILPLFGLEKHITFQYVYLRWNCKPNACYCDIGTKTTRNSFFSYQQEWADESTKTAIWEVAKFIHINTVAPFSSFRTQIRKWKKEIKK